MMCKLHKCKMLTQLKGFAKIAALFFIVFLRYIVYIHTYICSLYFNLVSFLTLFQESHISIYFIFAFFLLPSKIRKLSVHIVINYFWKKVHVDLKGSSQNVSMIKINFNLLPRSQYLKQKTSPKTEVFVQFWINSVHLLWTIRFRWQLRNEF